MELWHYAILVLASMAFATLLFIVIARKARPRTLTPKTRRQAQERVEAIKDVLAKLLVNPSRSLYGTGVNLSKSIDLCWDAVRRVPRENLPQLYGLVEKMALTEKLPEELPTPEMRGVLTRQIANFGDLYLTILLGSESLELVPGVQRTT